jgi:hypothetical protein
MRMHAGTAMIENGFVHLPKEAAWLAEYLHELTVFPKGKHDDQVDSTAQMLDWFKTRHPGAAGLDVDTVQASSGWRPTAHAARTVIGDGQAARHPPGVVTTTGTGANRGCPRRRETRCRDIGLRVLCGRSTRQVNRRRGANSRSLSGPAETNGLVLPRLQPNLR